MGSSVGFNPNKPPDRCPMSKADLLIFFIVVDGKYVVLPSGELQIRNVSAEDGFKTYKCRTKHRLTGETKLSATAGRLVITGRQEFIFIQNGPN